MKALVRYGPEAGSLRVQDVPDPTAEAGKVIVEVAACGICGTDAHQWHAVMAPGKPYPYVVGHEFSGTIAEVGEGVEGFSPGDRVAVEPFAVWCGRCRMCRMGRVNNCRHHSDMGFGQPGAFARYTAAPARGLHKVPDSVDVQDAAITEPLGVAYNTMFEESRVRPGDVIVVLGCGPVGLLCASLALAAGAEVVLSGWEGDDVRLRAARAAGVQHVLNAARDDLEAVVRDLTDPDGPDLVVDAAGSSDTFNQALRVAGQRGQITKVGWFGHPQAINLNAIVGKNLTVHGVYGGTWDGWEKCLRILAAGQVPLEHVITARLPLGDWEQGFGMMADRKAVKVLLLPD